MSLIYAREWNDIFNDPRTKSALPPLKLPKHQFFPLHLATLPTRPCSISPVSCTVLSRATSLSSQPYYCSQTDTGEEFFFASGTFEFRSNRSACTSVCVWKGKRYVWNDEDPTRIRRRELRSCLGIYPSQRYSTCHTLLRRDITK